MRVPQPAPLGGVALKGLHHRERDQLSVAELHLRADRGTWRSDLGESLQQVVGGDVQRGRSAAVRARLVGDVAESVEQMGPDSSAAVFGLATADVRLA
jgi:hypothetical protein